MRKVILFLFALVISYNTSYCQSNTKTGKGKQDSLSVAGQKLHRQYFLREKAKLQGEWYDLHTSEVFFGFVGDSIYYFRHKEWYKYSISNDTMSIYYPDGIFKWRYRVQGDTLIDVDVRDIYVRYRRNR